jgi:hypothetical protein
MGQSGMPISLHYFYSIIVWAPGGQAPWYDLCLSNKWLASMPELWERLTGYELTKAQKDLAAVAIIERLQPADANTGSPEPANENPEGTEKQL